VSRPLDRGACRTAGRQLSDNKVSDIAGDCKQTGRAWLELSGRVGLRSRSMGRCDRLCHALNPGALFTLQQILRRCDQLREVAGTIREPLLDPATPVSSWHPVRFPHDH
jgi:hypothetical protein